MSTPEDIRKNCEKTAVQARLCSVTFLDAISEGTLPRARGEATLEVERECGLANSRYFYGQRLHPKFGSVALVYRPEVESRYAGSANPFDTGGAFRGKTQPFKKVKEEDPDKLARRARALIRETRRDLVDWRQAFGSYLSDFFPEPKDYLAERPRPKRPNQPERYPQDLPVLHEENVASDDFRFCTWEVRIEADLPLMEALEQWACDEVSLQELNGWVLDDPDHPLAELAERGPTVTGDATDICKQLEKRLRDEW